MTRLERELTVMMSKTLVRFAFAAACMTAMPLAYAQAQDQLVTNGPQSDQGDMSPNWSAHQNVRESQWYDHLLQTSRAFREARMQKECGPITDPQLNAACLSTFRQDEPLYGSSTAPEPMRNSSGD
jgi:hypothetical protein